MLKPKKSRKYYIRLRGQFKPKKLKIIFLLESPPDSCLYFYNTNGEVIEPLYSAFMNFFNVAFNTKHEGLQWFADNGYFLVDATYIPVNNITPAAREQTILNDYEKLKSDLKSLIKSKDVKIIIVKCTLYDQLYIKLMDDNFNVINGKIRVPFPSHGHQNEFQTNLRLIFDKMETTSRRDEKYEEWTRFSMQNLSRAYFEDEPDYSDVLIKEPNPKYKP